MVESNVKSLIFHAVFAIAFCNFGGFIALLTFIAIKYQFCLEHSRYLFLYTKACSGFCHQEYRLFRYK